jgi:hypothetical protein
VGQFCGHCFSHALSSLIRQASTNPAGVKRLFHITYMPFSYQPSPDLEKLESMWVLHDRRRHGAFILIWEHEVHRDGPGALCARTLRVGNSRLKVRIARRGVTAGSIDTSNQAMNSRHARFPRLLALLLPGHGSSRIVRGIKSLLGVNMDEKNNRGGQGLACRDSQEEVSETEREYRERVRAAVERVRNQNREILDRLATK